MEQIMSQSHDYVPRNARELLVFAKNLYAYAMVHYTRWGVPSPQALLEAPIAAFEAALTAYESPNHGKIDTLNKDETQRALDKFLRTYIQGYLMRNPAVTDEDKEKMGLPLHDPTPTPHPKPDIKPQTEAVPSGKGRHTVTAIDPQSGNKRKPGLVEGVAFAHKLRRAEDPPIDPKEMPSEFQTGTVRAFQWEESDYGKVADYATAYENAGGKRGPWSDVVSLIIA
jgi:hypothetical protein